jgi:hypothetical protein
MRFPAAAVAIAIVLTWPAVVEAQSKRSKARTDATPQYQGFVPGRGSVARTGTRPCAGYAWWGCTGWDPDAQVRAMLGRDVGDFGP